MKETPQVKMKDKFSFTLGVMTICMSEWLVLRRPEYFPLFYIPLMLALLIYRYVDYSKIKSELYLLDFCYFVNLSVAIQVVLYPNNMLWFQANYVMCLGPICMAIVIWHNSLVFHSLDKVTSFFLHAFPPVVMHLHRWKMIKNDLPLDHESYLPIYANFVLPLLFYAVWQVTYLFMTEIALRNYLQDKEVVISLRYLVTDKKNPSVNLIKKFLRKQGIMKRNEELDPEAMSSKFIYVFCQAAYTLLTILHTRLLYAHYRVSCIYIITIFGIGVWNGASYYIEVFSKRYNLKFRATSEGNTEVQLNRTFSTQSNHNDNFVEALEKLDLDKPEDLKLYTTVLGSIASHNEKHSQSEEN